ncbi:hypothetical protein OU994_29845 [Pseudoduganella sp. SL102]|nr:hypothetical protein [Pseudoduganella sp. SL102]WBS02397.1 hypothetical protein OU994_29845 [Pseudoduganella sp. SL102]
MLTTNHGAWNRQARRLFFMALFALSSFAVEHETFLHAERDKRADQLV